jgi:hypothetical protein
MQATGLRARSQIVPDLLDSSLHDLLDRLALNGERGWNRRDMEKRRKSCLRLNRQDRHNG